MKKYLNFIIIGLLITSTAFTAAKIRNSDIIASAAIAFSKMAALTADRVPVTNVSGVITASSVTATTLGFLDATSSIQTQLNAKQALDAELTALAGQSGTGLYAVTGAGTGATRTVTAPAAGITVTDGNGVSGNPTLVLANDLAALEAMASTGIVARTASETYAQRSLTQPAAGVTISNADGVSGNPTFALANDLAALEALSSTGIIARTASETYAQRTITGPATGISVTDGNGVSGNPTLALANDLAALEALSGTNTIYYRNGSDSWAPVAIGTGIDFTSGTLSSTATGMSWYGGIQYAAASNCNWNVSNAYLSFTNYSADADCPDATTLGSGEGPGSKIPGMTRTNWASGTYLFIVTMEGRSLGGYHCHWRLSDGTTNSIEFSHNGTDSAGVASWDPGGGVVMTFGSTATRTVQIQASGGSAECRIVNDASQGSGLQINAFKLN